jgi:hypothetical protein
MNSRTLLGQPAQGGRPHLVPAASGGGKILKQFRTHAD